MSPRTLARTASTIGLVCLALALGAQAQGQATPGKSPTLSSGDVKFLQKAAAGNLAEIELSKLAQQKAMRGEVKQFADRMVQDHGRANDELKVIAAANGVTLPAAIDKKTSKENDKLAKLSGMDFDIAYMKVMLADHKKAVHEFQERVKSRKDNDARKYAEKMLPILISHREAAQATYDIVMEPKRTGKRKTGSTKK
jgi:putative membrane protein